MKANAGGRHAVKRSPIGRPNVRWPDRPNRCDYSIG
jgi:hypothetical protein